MCFLISNQFDNKEENKPHNAALLSLVSHQEEALMCGLKSKLILCHVEVYIYIFFMEAVMSLLLDLLLVD